MSTVTGRAVRIPDIRKPPFGKCKYDPKHDMRATSDAYQGIIRRINKHDKYVELRNVMCQIKSTIFADSDV